MVIGGTEITIGASLGVRLLDENTPPDALDAADRAMYHVKRRGGGVWMGAMA
jgi:GGDEF domain-containing protein